MLRSTKIRSLINLKKKFSPLSFFVFLPICVLNDWKLGQILSSVFHQKRKSDDE